MTRHPVTDDVTRLVDADAIKRSVRQLVLTSLFERPFEPSVGSRLGNLLFEPLDVVTEGLIVDEIQTLLTQFEPRIALISTTMNVNVDQNGFDCTIEFQILNIPQPVRLSILLARVR